MDDGYFELAERGVPGYRKQDGLYGRERLSQLVEPDNGKDRLLYRLVVTRWLAEDGSYAMRVMDFVDPEFEWVDPIVVKRAAKVREMVEKEMGGRG